MFQSIPVCRQRWENESGMLGDDFCIELLVSNKDESILDDARAACDRLFPRLDGEVEMVSLVQRRGVVPGPLPFSFCRWSQQSMRSLEAKE